MALATRQVIDGKAAFGGRTLAQWVHDAAAVLVEALDPLSIIVFGSVARGDDGPDSDIDLLVMIEDDRDQREAAVTGVRVVAGLPPEVDVIVVPRSSAEAHRDVPGTVIRPALREGKVVYNRAA